MIEVNTRFFCSCGFRYYHLFVGDVPLSSKMTIFAKCPAEVGGCGKINKAEYSFGADFKCIAAEKWRWLQKWMPFKKVQQHYIVRHFTKNEGNTDEEVFPVKCKCGKEVMLKQRRIL